jgi:hypothetical protein
MFRRVSIALLPAVSAVTSLALAQSAPPANSPYYTDTQSTQVQDATSQSIGTVNMIACIMQAMRPDALVNQGPYIALIDQNKCNAAKENSTSGSGSGSGGSGSTQAPSYMTAAVNSTRTSNSDPMIADAWISTQVGTNNGSSTAATIYAHISATQAPSNTNPYGVFRLDYCGIAVGDQSNTCLMNGFMETDANGTLSYYEQDGGGGGSQTTALALSSIGTSSGSGSLQVNQSGNGQSQQQGFDFTYNAGYYYRTSGNNQYECFSRSASDPGTQYSVWDYDLYDLNGNEVNLNSGFPIQYTISGTTYQGYVGYYGLSGQPGAALPANGSTVQQISYNNNSAATASYTVVSSGGRLVRNTMQATTLALINQVPLNVFIGSPAPTGLVDANTQYVMYWSESAGMFVATGEIQCGQSGCNTAAVNVGNGQTSNAVNIDPSYWTGSNMGLQAWSNSLGGGNVFVAFNNPGTPLDQTQVVYYLQNLVYPGDPSLPATLYCVNNCPTAAAIAAYFGQGSSNAVASPYDSATFNSYQPSTAYDSYTVSGNILVDSQGSQVVDTTASDYQNCQAQGCQQYQNGIMSGNLVASLSDALCPNGPGGQPSGPPQYCSWVTNQATTYYTWQTGPNSWDQFSALQDSNNHFVQFDAPLNVSFTVPANTSGNNPYGSYARSTMVLQYGGVGNLWGIPNYCVNTDTNQPDPNCSNAQNDISISAFEIPFDPALGVVTYTPTSGPAVTYWVKWLNRQILFAQYPDSTCTSAGLSTTTAQLPTSAGLQNPSDPRSSVYNGVEPTFNGNPPAPRVIQGVVEY